jgi:hypothetical protein
MLRPDQVLCSSLEFNWGVLYRNRYTFDYTYIQFDLGTVRLAQDLQQSKYSISWGQNVLQTF